MEGKDTSSSMSCNVWIKVNSGIICHMQNMLYVWKYGRRKLSPMYFTVCSDAPQEDWCQWTIFAAQWPTVIQKWFKIDHRQAEIRRSYIMWLKTKEKLAISKCLQRTTKNVDHNNGSITSRELFIKLVALTEKKLEEKQKVQVLCKS